MAKKAKAATSASNSQITDRWAKDAARQKAAESQARHAYAEAMRQAQVRDEWVQAWRDLAGPASGPDVAAFDRMFGQLAEQEKRARVYRVAALCRKHGQVDTAARIRNRLGLWLDQYHAGEPCQWPMASFRRSPRLAGSAEISPPTHLVRLVALAAEVLVRAVEGQTPLTECGQSVNEISPYAWQLLWGEVVRASEQPTQPHPMPQKYVMRCGNRHGEIELDSPPVPPYRCPSCEAEKRDAIDRFVYRVGHATGETRIAHRSAPELQAKILEASAQLVGIAARNGLCEYQTAPTEAANAVIAWALAHVDPASASRAALLKYSVDDVRELLKHSGASSPALETAGKDAEAIADALHDTGACIINVMGKRGERETQGWIVAHAVGGGNCERTFANLRRQGLIDSKGGPGGGTALTPLGKLVYQILDHRGTANLAKRSYEAP